jgi:hypothetical protein
MLLSRKALELVSGPVVNLGDGVRGPFRVLEVRDDGVVLLITGSTGFGNAAAFRRYISIWRDTWTSTLCMLLLQRPDLKG